MSRLRLSPLMALILLGLAGLNASAMYVFVNGWGETPLNAPPQGAIWAPPKFDQVARFEPKPRAAFAQITGRPIFSKTRRPFEPPEPVSVTIAGTQASAAPALPSSPKSEPSVTLSAVTIAGTNRRALVVSKEQPEGEWLEVGDVIEGWSISAIAAETLLLTSGGQSLTMRLYQEAAQPPKQQKRLR